MYKERFCRCFKCGGVLFKYLFFDKQIKDKKAVVSVKCSKCGIFNKVSL